MFLAEIVADRNQLTRKIDEAKEYLMFLVNNDSATNHKNFTETLDSLFNYLAQYQSKTILINKLIHNVDIKIGDSDTKMSNVIELRNSFEARSNILLDLIKASKIKQSSNSVLDLDKLIKDRESLLEEINKLNKILEHTSWNVSIENKQNIEQDSTDNDNEEDVGQV